MKYQNHYGLKFIRLIKDLVDNLDDKDCQTTVDKRK